MKNMDKLQSQLVTAREDQPQLGTCDRLPNMLHRRDFNGQSCINWRADQPRLTKYYWNGKLHDTGEAQGEAPQVKTLIAKRDALSEKHFQLGGQHADLGSRNCPCDVAKEWRAADLECDAAITNRNSVRRKKSEPKCDHDHCDCGVETGAHPSQDALLISHDEARKLVRLGVGDDGIYLRLCQYIEQQRARSTPSLPAQDATISTEPAPRKNE